MTQLETLIQTLCPNGVKFVPLWSVTAWDKHFKGIDKSMQQKIISYPYLLAADLFALDTGEGDVFLLSTGAKTGWTTEEKAGEYLREGEVVAIPWGGTPNVKYYKGKFVTADNRIATSLDTNVLNNKFLYYWMNNNIDLIAGFYRGAGIQHPSMYDILSLQIPLPPLAVQSEIVRVLDKFTLYKSELAAELAVRLQQYEYYRDKLLTFDDIVKRVKLGDVAEVGTGSSNGNEAIEGGAYPFFVRSKDIKRLDTYEYDEEAIIIPGEGGIGDIFHYVHGKFALHQRVYRIHFLKGDINTRFAYFYLCAKFKTYIMRKAVSATVTSIRKPMIENFELPLPPLSEQERIVSILDRFDKLCHDIREGLPAEIDLRQKQYEHYRDKLLTFTDIIGYKNL